MDIKKRALELLGINGISEEERMRNTLDESNQQQETIAHPEDTSFFDKLKNLYKSEEPYTKGPGVRLNQEKVKKFRKD